MSEQQERKRGSTPGNDEQTLSGKKPRAQPQVVAPGVVVKQEPEEAGAVMAVQAMDEPQIKLTFGVSLFHCQACLLPLKPPTFKCEAGHVVCCTCRGKHGQASGRAATYAACRERDAFVRDAKLPCRYEEFGCKSLVVYYQAADHHGACEWAPCSCPAPGCDFFTSPPRLVEHFVADHRWRVTKVRYGAACKLPVPAPPQGCHVLVGEGGRSVFLVSQCALGAATAVSLVCVRANGDAAAGAAQFKCKLWVEVELPSNKDKLVLNMSAVRSSDLSGGFPAADMNVFLAVPPVLLHDASGDAPDLMVCIDKACVPGGGTGQE
ncbi:uncharacterized protein C2845_PM07G02620 [Panicum miliaceum]|uniref:SIAH-type domain-containing protein n=1 Tax=Panicum miliaceum TaxID=4540 RepID=A0A3L6SJ20_PANMI|nr:uncharacterized protein C2845_PM07G02620 [Panicum miliaceum]